MRLLVLLEWFVFPSHVDFALRLYELCLFEYICLLLKDQGTFFLAKSCFLIYLPLFWYDPSVRGLIYISETFEFSLREVYLPFDAFVLIDIASVGVSRY